MIVTCLLCEYLSHSLVPVPLAHRCQHNSGNTIDPTARLKSTTRASVDMFLSGSFDSGDSPSSERIELYTTIRYPWKVITVMKLFIREIRVSHSLQSSFSDAWADRLNVIPNNTENVALGAITVSLAD